MCFSLFQQLHFVGDCQVRKNVDNGRRQLEVGDYKNTNSVLWQMLDDKHIITISNSSKSTINSSKSINYQSLPSAGAESSPYHHQYHQMIILSDTIQIFDYIT